MAVPLARTSILVTSLLNLATRSLLQSGGQAKANILPCRSIYIRVFPLHPSQQRGHFWRSYDQLTQCNVKFDILCFLVFLNALMHNLLILGIRPEFLRRLYIHFSNATLLHGCNKKSVPKQNRISLKIGLVNRNPFVLETDKTHYNCLGAAQIPYLFF